VAALRRSHAYPCCLLEKVRVGGAKTPSNITVKGKLTGPTPQFPRLAITTLHMVASHFHGTDAVDGNTGTIRCFSSEIKVELQRVDDVVKDDWEEATSKLLRLEDFLLDSRHKRPVITPQNVEDILHDRSATGIEDILSAVLQFFEKMAMAAV
jgi:hypothetical protein